MFKRLQFFFFILLTVSCIEPYEFRIHDNDPTIVIEAAISNKSFTETLTYPSDGRYFTVKVSRTSDVINTRPEMVQGADVKLISDQGEEWNYTHSFEMPGVYRLLDANFKALAGVQYKLQVALSNEEIYESNWESLPTSAPPIGMIGFKETSVRRFGLDNSLTTVKVVNPYISIPINNTGAPIYYRWSYTPLWIYIAPLASTGEERTCWATNQYYINNYTMHLDNSGGYNKDLIFIDVDYNERVLEELSLLVVQQNLSEEHYYFWKEMQDLNQGAAIFDSPPFNLKTNFHSQNGKRVSGYFGVSGEQAQRWYFNTSDLSYRVLNTRLEDCSFNFGPGWPYRECVDCKAYQGGNATPDRPTWWGR
jgi:hypothetical protein